VPTESLRAAGAATVEQARREGVLDLEGSLDEPSLREVAVGAGNAVFVKGRCREPAGRRIERLTVALGGEEHLLMGYGISDRRLGGTGDIWWGVVPLAGVSEPAERLLTLRAELEGGLRAEARLASWRLVPALDAEPVPAPAGAAGTPGPLIAICMATFEPPLELFARQIESIRSQTHENWTCVISDDNSPPERLAEIRRVLGGDERFVLAPSDVRRGFYGNFERALALAPAEAEYLALSDQDDRWHPDKLEVLLGELEQGALLAYSDTRVVDESGRVLSDTYWRYRANNYTDFTSLVITNAITGAASLFRRELAERGLPFPPPHGDIFHDHWLALVAMASGEIRYVDRTLYDYVQHSAAALGFSRANAGRGRWGGWLADVTLRMLRLASRVIRPVGQVRYFDNYCRLVLESRALEERLGDALSPAERSALRRIQACDGSLRGAAWFALRTFRPLIGRNETMGMERGLLAGLLWRLLAGLRAHLTRVRSSA
jgi:glycosyltransferase involved in cell wall biosynthesis